MLKRLTIRNVALIDEADLEFSEGLNVLTGETGAGKSVILDSIDFVLGAKADKGMIRTGADACTVRAEFSADTPAVLEALEALDIDAEETLVISRRLGLDGKGTLKLNGCSVTSSMLRRVTSLLVDIHGQSEHFFLLKEANQLKLLDEVGGERVQTCKEELSLLLAKRKETLSELSRFGTDEGERDRRLDVLTYQIDEIRRAELKEGEEEELLSKKRRYESAEKILTAFSAVREALEADGGGIDAVNTACRETRSVSELSESYAELLGRLEAASSELSDIAGTAESLSDELEIDEREFERVEARLDEVRSLKKKYGGSVSAALEFLARAEEEYSFLSEGQARFDALSGELAALDRKIYAACVKLKEARAAAANDFTSRVVKELGSLNIPSAKFEVQFDEFSEADAPHATAEGLGGVRFLFSANAGEPLKELSKVASGGEMSRFMLAVKAQLSAAGGIGTYLFDEIDAGIGGKTARVVAEKFVKISRDVQLIAVTHLAQIAAFADCEFLIEKREAEGRTFTEIHEVKGEARIRELSRLIGGKSEHVSAHARELLEEAATYKNSL